VKRAALYIRVSTLEQANEGYSVGEQKERLTSFCKARDWLVSDFYIDPGYSGANLDRPAIQKLIAEVKKTDIVLVYKLDRISRSQRDMLYLIEEVFLPNGVDFVSMSESFDTSVPFGRAMIGILSVFAQLEREQIKERTKMGKLARAKEGLFHGGIYYPIGYDYVNGRLVPNEYEAAQVQKIFEWYIEGMSPDKISERLRSQGYTNKYSSWSELSHGVGVLRVLSSEVYLGTLKYDDVIVDNAHEALVTKEQFNQVKAIRKKRQEIYGDSAYKSKYLLTGLLFCAKCGARYAVKHNYGGYKYYVCYSRAKTVKYMAKAINCDNRNWRLDELESVIEAQVKRLLVNPKYYDKLVKEHKKKSEVKKPRGEADIIGDKIKNLDKQISKLMDLYQAEGIPVNMLSARIDKLYREKTALEEQLAKVAPPEPETDFNEESITDLLKDFADVWDVAAPEQKRQVIQALINRITLDGDKVNIEWSFLPNKSH
jgi:site-specific DNA recombinase